MATKTVTLKDSNGDTLYPVTDSNVVNINQQKTLAQALDGVVYAEDPTQNATPTAWVTGSDINWSTFLVKRNLTLTTDSTGNIATDIPIATYDVISCRCTNPNNSRNVFITPYAWSTGYWQIHVQNVAGNGAYQGSLNVDFLLIDKTKTGV